MTRLSKATKAKIVDLFRKGISVEALAFTHKLYVSEVEDIIREVMA